MTDFLRVGDIVKPHGIEGELVVDPSTDHPERRFEAGRTLTVFRGRKRVKNLTSSSFRWHQDRLLLETQEIDNRNQAEELRNTWLGIRKDEKVELNDGFYGHELLGLNVYTENKEARGTVVDVYPNDINPLIEIEVDGEFLDFPLSPGLVRDVDPDENRLVLKFPSGWKKLKRSDE